MRRKLLRLRPYLIAAAVGTILIVDLSNQWEVPIAQLPNELHDRYVSELKADAKPADLLKLAEGGNSQAQYIYALRHTTYAPAELQIREDQKVAYTWMQKAAENRHARAMAVVALYFARGLGVAKDETKAAEWATKAADKGQPMGYRVLGDLAKAKADAIKPTKGAPDSAKQQADRDLLLDEAYKQYLRGANAGTRAAARRDGKSIRILAERHESGEKTPKDLQQAYAWRLVLIEIEDNPEDVAKLGELEKKMKLEDVQAGQELAIKLIKDLPSESADALARLNPGR